MQDSVHELQFDSQQEVPAAPPIYTAIDPEDQQHGQCQLHSDCLFCGEKGHQLATCQRQLSILDSTGKANPNIKFWLQQTNLTTPVTRRECHPFGIQPSQATRHF